MTTLAPPHPSDVAAYPSEEYQAALMAWIIHRIWGWKDDYYNGDTTVVDDATYDLWWANLLALEKRYPHLILPNSPTETVGAPLEH